MGHWTEHSVLSKLLPRKAVASTDARGKDLCFKMHSTSKMEKYRADTFYTKEPETLVWIYSFKGNALFIDVGANIGVYSLHAAGVKPGIEVYAFEPMLENYTRLVDNILLNDFRNITPINAGVGKRPSVSKFFVKDRGVGASGSQLNEPIDEYGKKITVQCERKVLTVSFDSFMGLIPINRPVYLKIDVDGREMDVLEGVAKHAGCMESVLVEINTDQVSLGDVTAHMKACGLVPDASINHFRPHSSDRRGGNPVNVVFTRPY